MPVFTSALRAVQRRIPLSDSLYPVSLADSFPLSGAIPNAIAAALAMLPRRAVMLFGPLGWTAFARTITYVSETGSIHSEVPVNPVWPNDPTGKIVPRLLEYGDSMSQPKPRRAVPVAGCSGVTIFMRVARENGNLLGLPASLSSNSVA